MNTPINRDKVSAAVKLLTEILDDFDREMNDDIEAEDFNIGQDESIELPTESFRTLLADHAAQAEDIERQSEALNRATDESDAKDREIKALGLAITAKAEEIDRLNERLENNHMFDAQGGRVDVEPGSIPDGIECRDETIKFQDERITALTFENTNLRDEVGEWKANANEAQEVITAQAEEISSLRAKLSEGAQ